MEYRLDGIGMLLAGRDRDARFARTYGYASSRGVVATCASNTTMRADCLSQ